MRTATTSSVCALAMLLVAALLFTPALAEKRQHEPYALIFGTVWSPDGRPAAGVRVKIRRAGQKKAQWELVSDRRGEFAQRVPAGKADYVVSAGAKSKHSRAAAEARVHVENDERVDISLHLTE